MKFKKYMRTSIVTFPSDLLDSVNCEQLPDELQEYIYYAAKTERVLDSCFYLQSFKTLTIIS
jgi:hypothetical protein